MDPRKATDTYPFKFHLRDQNGNFPLTGGTWQVFITLTNKRTGFVRVNLGACTILDVLTGYCQYAPADVDIGTPGAYNVEIYTVSPAGIKYHWPNEGFEPLYIGAPLA